MKRKRYSRKFQRMAVEWMRTCESVTELARELGVRPRCLYNWRAKLDQLESGEESARASTHEGSYRKKVLRLERLLAEKTLEVDFFNYFKFFSLAGKPHISMCANAARFGCKFAGDFAHACPRKTRDRTKDTGSKTDMIGETGGDSLSIRG